jgi:DNA-directed RNA polymerase subunit M/transcription elongation factor TFIIS
MLYLKACPRCQGDIEYNTDMYGAFLACLHCGYVIDSKEEALVAMKQSAARTKAA